MSKLAYIILGSSLTVNFIVILGLKGIAKDIAAAKTKAPENNEE